MSQFLSATTAGMGARWYTPILHHDSQVRDWSRWWDADTTDPWEDGVLWPNSSLQGAGYFKATRHRQMARDSGARVYPRFMGISRDSSGAALGGATIKSYLTETDVEQAACVSDAGGFFDLVSPVPQNGVNHYLVAYNAGSPDVAGTSINTLNPT